SIDNPGRVHCSAPSDTSFALRGLRAAGTRSGSSARLLGTSAAAPQISRAIALAWLNAPAGRRAPAPAPGGDVSAVVIEDLQPIDAPAAPG
ncbi:hypothetical protein, partial [Klebsiella variicola]|uniref:hypothetical protein n=1 Tax=Klebsiella variicola TaxID=244366 RepID=UPI00195370F5